MIAPLKEPTHKKTIKLLPQEKGGTYKFNGRLKEVERKGGLDYLQVFDIEGQKLWFIDDVNHVTCLLPDDY